MHLNIAAKEVKAAATDLFNFVEREKIKGELPDLDQLRDVAEELKDTAEELENIVERPNNNGGKPPEPTIEQLSNVITRVAREDEFLFVYLESLIFDGFASPETTGYLNNIGERLDDAVRQLKNVAGQLEDAAITDEPDPDGPAT